MAPCERGMTGRVEEKFVSGSFFAVESTELVTEMGVFWTESACADTVVCSVIKMTNRQMFKNFLILFFTFQFYSYLCI